MSTKRGFTIEFPATARLVFSGLGSGLVINPRPRACEFQFAPGTNYSCAKCGKSGTDKIHRSETGMSDEPIAVPAKRVIDEGDAASPWFAFWEEDCMSPPIWIVRAESFEQAYEDFIDSRPEVKIEDLDEDQRAMAEGDGNLPDGYTFSNDGKLVYTESIQGREISLVEVTQ